MTIFKRKRADNQAVPAMDNVLLRSLLDGETITRKKALNIPAVARCVNLISEIVSMIPIKLYREEIIDNKRKTVEIIDDGRCSLLNEDTKDTLDGVQFKRALVRDYLLDGNAYAYINKQRNNVMSLHYVDCNDIFISKNYNPIFKDYNISVLGQNYKPFEFIKVLKSTKDGASGTGVIEENNELLLSAYTTMKFEQSLVSTGGSKKGFIKAEKRISKEAMDAIRQAWKNLYCTNESNVLILNEGLDFKEASNTSTEMQLNENKNSLNNSILDIFGVPTNWDWETFIKTAVMPVLITLKVKADQNICLIKMPLYF